MARITDTLLDKVANDSLSAADRAELNDQLRAIELDHDRPIGERMAAIVFRAALQARALHVTR